MAIFDFFLSRNSAVSTAENYVGHIGRLFYDSSNGVIKISDGVTPGGLSIPYTIATDTVIGGIKAGPGVSINSEGQILIDSEGLEFSFGDFTGTVGTYAVGNPDAGEDYALLQSLNVNEDIIIATNGTGVVKILGDFSVRATDGSIDDILLNEAVFKVAADGQIQMLVPGIDAFTGALEIIGNNAGTKFSTNQTGVILHVTGNTGLPNRTYLDSSDNYSLIVGRRLNGSIESPEGILNGDVILRIAAQGLLGDSGSGYVSGESLDFSTFGVGRIEWAATEDQFLGAQGGEMRVLLTPNGSPGTSAVNVATFNPTTGLTATKFNGSVTIGSGNTLDVTGATVTGLTLGGLNPADVAGTMTGTTIKSTVTGSSLTSVGTLTSLSVSGTTVMNTYTGKHYRDVRNAGVIADSGTLTINFATDSIVYCEWGNGFTVNYSNYTAGSVVKLIAYKTAGTGTDNFSLDGITAAHVSSGTTTVSGTAALTSFVEFVCTGTTLGSVYVKV